MPVTMTVGLMAARMKPPVSASAMGMLNSLQQLSSLHAKQFVAPACQ